MVFKEILVSGEGVNMLTAGVRAEGIPCAKALQKECLEANGAGIQ